MISSCRIIISLSAEITENCVKCSGAPGDMVVAKYRVVKKSLCTWWLQYRKLQVMFRVSPTSLRTFIDTPNCVLKDRVQYSTVHIPNVFCDCHLPTHQLCGDCSSGAQRLFDHPVQGNQVSWYICTFPHIGHHTEQQMLANYPVGWDVHKTPITCWDIQNIHVARCWVLAAGDVGWLSVRAWNFCVT